MLSLLHWEHGLFFPFGALPACAVLCSRRRIDAAALRAIWFATLSYGLAIAVFFPSARYRLPSLLWLIPLAAIGCAELIERAARSGWSAYCREAWPRLALAVALLIATNLPNAFSAGFAATPGEQLRLEGEALKAQGRLPAAIARVDAALRLEPERADSHVVRAELAMQTGAFELASDHFRRATSLLPDSEAAWVLLAEAQDSHERFAQALESLRRALRINPFHRQALLQRAHIHMRAGEPHAAIEAFRRYLRSYSGDRARFDLSRLLLAERDHRAAIELLRELSRRHRESLAVRRLLRAAEARDRPSERESSPDLRDAQSSGARDAGWSDRIRSE